MCIHQKGNRPCAHSPEVVHAAAKALAEWTEPSRYKSASCSSLLYYMICMCCDSLVSFAFETLQAHSAGGGMVEACFM